MPPSRIPRRLRALGAPFALLLALALPAPAAAQLSGLVFDGIEGTPLGGATLTVLTADYAVVREATSDPVGRYSIATMSGAWLVVSMPGYASSAPIEIVPHLPENLLVPMWPRAADDEEEVVERNLDDRPDDAMVFGFVVDAATGRPLVGARVTLAERNQSALTRAGGRFVIDPVIPGVVIATVEMIGYEPREIAVPVDPGSGYEMRVPLTSRAIELEGIEVTTRSRFVARRLQDAYMRADIAPMGRYVMRDEIERRGYPRLLDLIRGRASVRIDRVGPHYAVRLRGCSPSLWVDGMRVAQAGDDEQISNWIRDPSYDVEMVEVFPGASSLPPEYNEPGTFCAIAVWTRRGG